MNRSGSGPPLGWYHQVQHGGDGQGSRGAKDDPKLPMRVSERLAGPGRGKLGGSNSGRFVLRNRKDKDISYENK